MSRSLACCALTFCLAVASAPVGALAQEQGGATSSERGGVYRQSGDAFAAARQATADCDTGRHWVDSCPDKTEAIYDKLGAPLTRPGFEFADTPLDEILDFIGDEYNLTTGIDAQALDALGLGPDVPITVHLRETTLGAALRTMLQQLELTYVVSDGVLTVTTEEESTRLHPAAVYCVGNVDLDKKTLRDALQTLANDTWKGQGGEGDLVFLSNGAVLISQTTTVHEKVDELLTAIGAAQHSEPAHD